MKRLAVVVAVVAVVLAGCGDPLRGMRALPPGQPEVPTPPAGKAAVVFLRPEAPGYSASVFDLRKDRDEFVGLVLANTKVLYVADPGTTRFMLISPRRAEFMDAELEAGKTYHVLLTQAGGAGFALAPLSSRDANLPRLLKSCEWIENTSQSQAWARSHWTDIQTRKQQFLPEFEKRSTRPTLRASDGR